MRLQDCFKIAVCVGLLSMGPGPMAEELYVRNRPFRGYRSGNGRSMQVDVNALIKLLELPTCRSGGSLRLGDTSPEESDSGEILRIQAGDTFIPFIKGPAGELVVPLRETIEALGGKVELNRPLNLVEVQLAKGVAKPTASAQTQTSSTSTSPSPETSIPESSSPISSGGGLEGARANPRIRPTRDNINNLTGFQSSDGRWAIPPTFYEADRNGFSFGLAAAREDKGTTQSVKTSNQYTIVGGGYSDLSDKDKRTYDAARRVKVTPQRVPGLWGYIDGRGGWLLPPQFEKAGTFQMREFEGHRQIAALVQKGGLSYWIDPQGSKLSDAAPTSSQSASGHVSTPPTFLSVHPDSVELEIRAGNARHLFTLAQANGGSFELRPDPVFVKAGLSFNPVSGSLRGSTKITVSALNGSKPGTYRGVVTVLDGNRSPTKVPVTITISGP